jgi:sulfotransferase
VANAFHFISGLPRSGSTLLSVLLKQNPHFFAAVTSPVLGLVSALITKMSDGGEFSTFFDDQRRMAVLRGIFDAYYGDHPFNGLIFDTNRTWTARLPILLQLYPEAHIICCVREIGWIVDSIEQMLRRNPTRVSRIFNFKPGSSIYARVETLMNSESGLVGLSWASLREAWFGPYANRLIVVNYESLVSRPEAILRRIVRRQII